MTNKSSPTDFEKASEAKCGIRISENLGRDTEYIVKNDDLGIKLKHRMKGRLLETEL
ncbi:MAG: hypothetical protein QMD22_01725 [archaeon]|nr:hypothetical protein [archaeon]